MSWVSKALNAIAAIAFVAVAVAIGSTDQARADSLTDAMDTRPTHVVINYAGIAASGYDVVAFVTRGQAVKGRRDTTAEYDGATYRFANDANREIFMTDPRALEPQFGGYAAYGVRLGRKATPDTPLIWQVSDDKLYFFADEETKALWNEDVEFNTRVAQNIWQQIRIVPPALLVKSGTD